MVCLIASNISKEKENYDIFYNTIVNISDKKIFSVFESSLLISTKCTQCKEVFEKIKPHLNTEDRVLIVEVVDNYWGWLNEEQWSFVQNNFFNFEKN